MSGGGYGHAPAHSGYVGEGMLTVSVTGKHNQAPECKLIVKAIEKVTGKLAQSQVLLIVKNYQQDITEFRKAAEICINKYNMRIKMIIVSDNCDSEQSGVAGTILVHKIAGHLSERNKSLDEIVACLNDLVLPHLASIGIAKTDAKKFQLGIGIHAEPSNLKGVEYNGKLETLMQPMFEELWKKFSSNSQDEKSIEMVDEHSTDKIIVFLNNLGGKESIYQDDLLIKVMGIIMEYIQMHKKNVTVKEVFYGTYMTSSDIKNGFSVTVLGIDDDRKILDALDSNVSVKAWNHGLSVDKFYDILIQSQNQQMNNALMDDNHFRDDTMTIGTITDYPNSHLSSDIQLQQNEDNAI